MSAFMSQDTKKPEQAPVSCREKFRCVLKRDVVVFEAIGDGALAVLLIGRLLLA
jgi:hypothetical protein